ncbi:hypothetical protein Tco_1408884 [Tanacetum coccineum]
MYERQKKYVQDFVPIGSAKEEELIKKMNKKATHEDTSNKEEMKATKKSKRQKIDSDLEEEEQLRASLKIVPDEKEEIDYEVMGMRVLRANGSSRYIKTFTEMVSRFDRLDFIELHNLVMQRFSTTSEGNDLARGWGTSKLASPKQTALGKDFSNPFYS